MVLCGRSPHPEPGGVDRGEGDHPPGLGHPGVQLPLHTLRRAGLPPGDPHPHSPRIQLPLPALGHHCEYQLCSLLLLLIVYCHLTYPPLFRSSSQN